MTVRNLLLGLSMLAAAPAAAQDLFAIRDHYVTESRLLDVDLDNYVEAREREEEALLRLVSLGRALDAAMADASVPADELVRLHREIAEAREAAYSVSADAGNRREEMGQRMESMQQALAELEQGGVQYVDPNGEVGGTWLVESQEEAGLISLRQDGARVSGLYRLSNGRHGTLLGRFRGSKLKIELDDNDYGMVGSLEGELDARGEIAGQWSARELAAGRATGGTWTGRRLSFDDLLELEP